MLRIFHLLVVLLCAAALSVPTVLAAQVATPAATPGAVSHGSLLAAMDTSVDPGEDFYRYATGGWQDRTTIPPDKAAYGVSTEIHDLTTQQLLALLRGLAGSDTLPEGSDEWKAVQLFEQGIDYDTRNAQGIEPIAGDLALIDAIANLDDLYTFLRESVPVTNAPGLYGVGPGVDLRDSSIYTLWYGGPALGLPNRDYYWEDDETNEPIRQAYRDISARLLGFIGYDEAAAADAMQRVYDFEKRLAEPLLSPEAYNDPANYYHPRPVADLAAANPDFDWPAFFDILGIPESQETVVITQEAYLDAIDGIVASTDLETIKDYLKVQVLWNTASALTKEMDDTAFSFATVLSGVEEQLPDEEQALGAVNGALGEALGKLYVETHFPPEAKAQIEELVGHIKDATRARIERLEWMTPQTKEEALAKLDAMRVKVGYPDKWRTYENVTIGDSYVASILSADIAEYKREIARLGKPVDRDEWHMLPQTVNAYYSPTNNEIVFPAAILQPPFFDYQADPAFNFGGIGATIGHEITHAFDQSGSQFDANGNLRNWWTPEDTERFTELKDEVIAQYDEIEVAPDLFVNGELTIGENIADMGGMQIAFDALQAALAAEGDPGLIEGLTQEQRFFVAHAYRWAIEMRPEVLVTQVKTDEHAPAAIRAVEPARHMAEFFAAFDIGPDEPLYLPPEERIVIW